MAPCSGAATRDPATPRAGGSPSIHSYHLLELAAVPTTFASLRLDLLAKLIVATVLGGAIGLEREFAGKPAGLRTNMLICLGAALFTHLSVELAQVGFSPDGRPFGDPSRIAAQIVVGIGFLGAGAILHARGVVVGLTTAATIWVVAAIGTAVGSGAYLEAVGATALILIVLAGLRPVELRILAKRKRLSSTIRVQPSVSFEAIEAILNSAGLHVLARNTFEHTTDRAFELGLVGTQKQFDVAVDELRRRTDVISVTLD